MSIFDTIIAETLSMYCSALGCQWSTNLVGAMRAWQVCVGVWFHDIEAC